MTKRVTQTAALIAAIILGGSLMVLLAKQDSANPAARTNSVCAMQNVGQHMGMGRMMAMHGMITSHHMNVRAMTGMGSSAGAKRCHEAAGTNSPIAPGPDNQSGSASSAPAGHQQ